MEETQKARIIQLLKDGVGVRGICRIEGISNTPVYKAMKELGMGHKKMEKRQAEEAMVKVARFVCPGIEHCAICKHIFESVCPLG